MLVLICSLYTHERRCTMYLPVLLKGYLDSFKINKAREEISTLKRPMVRERDELTLIIDSDGGNIAPALEFIEFLGTIRSRAEITSRVYNAKSMAAVVAFTADNIEMDKDGTIDIHRGSLQLEASDFDLGTGQISENALLQFRKYDEILKQILEKYGICQSQKLMAELYGSNWLKLDADKCREHCLVNKIF